MARHIIKLSKDVRLTIPREIVTKMNLTEDSYVAVVEKERSFEVFKAKWEIDQS